MSRKLDGSQAHFDSYSSSISGDGRYITYETAPARLVTETTYIGQELLYDTETGETTVASTASDGSLADRTVHNSFISANGRYIAFASLAENLSEDDRASTDIFVKDRETGQVFFVSRASDGSAGEDSSYAPALSADGRYVVFTSSADNLVANDTNKDDDVFVHDRETGETTRVSVASGGLEADSVDGDSGFVLFPQSISADGRYVAFQSRADGLAPNDVNTDGNSDIFVHDRQTVQTTLVSISSDGMQADPSAAFPSISATGRYVSFVSRASNLVADDTNDSADIFVHDRETGQTTRVSVASDGTQGNADSGFAAISGDGRYVAFQSQADNMVPNDTNGKDDVFVHDQETGKTTLVSVAADGAQGNDNSYGAAISANGQHISFYSYATNLVAGDTNGLSDVFVRSNGW